MPLTPEMRSIFQLARASNASDIHIVAGLPPTFRVSGEIILANVPPLSREDTRRLAYDLLNEEQREAFEADWQLCSSLYDDMFGRFRVSIYYHNGNPELAIRPVNTEIKTRDDLRLPAMVELFTRQSNGLVLITGPTGSGKTTTLNYMVDLINCERRCKVITIEDPVEYVHERKKAIIIQQELYTDVKSFSAALIHVLRQNPDVICIGEMRDYETTSTALTAAETGHLVIATCHTPNSILTVERIVSVFPPQQQAMVLTQLANSLRGVVAQRLIPSADKTRRLLAAEVLLANHATRHIIREGDFHRLMTVIQMSRTEGMQAMDDSLLDLYYAGEITYDTALNNAQDPNTLKARIHADQNSDE